jgi:hypothetical protein
VSKRIGRDFDPSLGFVPRAGVYLYQFSANFSPRIGRGPLQQMFFEFEPSMTTNLSGAWESYRVFMAPVNWRFRSGDRLEFNVNPTGERLTQPFEVSSAVVIQPGSYEWRQYRLEAGTAQKRRVYCQLTWWFGGSYDGTLDQYEWTGAWNPTPLVTVEFTGERNIGRLSSGRFTQTLVGSRLRLNLSSDFSISSSAVRHCYRIDPREHACPVDVQSGRGSVRPVQPQHAVSARPVGTPIQPAPRQAAVRLAHVAGSRSEPERDAAGAAPSLLVLPRWPQTLGASVMCASCRGVRHARRIVIVTLRVLVPLPADQTAHTRSAPRSC